MSCRQADALVESAAVSARVAQNAHQRKLGRDAAESESLLQVCACFIAQAISGPQSALIAHSACSCPWTCKLQSGSQVLRESLVQLEFPPCFHAFRCSLCPEVQARFQLDLADGMLAGIFVMMGTATYSTLATGFLHLQLGRSAPPCSTWLASLDSLALQLVLVSPGTELAASRAGCAFPDRYSLAGPLSTALRRCPRLAALPGPSWLAPLPVLPLLSLLVCWAIAVWQLLSGAVAMLVITWCPSLSLCWWLPCTGLDVFCALAVASLLSLARMQLTAGTC